MPQSRTNVDQQLIDGVCSGIHGRQIQGRLSRMTQLARDTGLSRERLYKSLSGERAPNPDTLFKVIHAMGFKLTVEPIVTQG